LHDQEFQHLEAINERLLAGEAYDPDHIAQRRPGRTGDDALAFRINRDSRITDVLTLEAKCMARNNLAKIEEAHRKLATARMRPSGVRELINLLDEYDTPDAQAWQKALLDLWREGYRDATRHDGVAYTCGQIPARPSGRIAWMPTRAPHPAYTVARNLEGMEFQFEDLNTVIGTLYRGA
jgi:enamine deaminase RidA (YjgF/YER057c/UK114 family)